MRTRDFSFGASVLDEADLPEELRRVLEPWIGEFAADGFAEDVSSKGVNAWAVRHDAVIEHEAVLAERLSGVLAKVASI